MTERTLVYVRLSELVPDEMNPKEHADAELAASMGRFGFTEPLLLDERTGKIIAGHGRLGKVREQEAADEEPPEGVTRADDGEWMAPVIFGWASADDDDAKAYLIASNRTSEVGGWQPERLAEGLVGLDLLGVGFDTFDVEELRPAALDVVAPLADLTEFGGKHVQSVILNFPTETYDHVIETARRARVAMGVEDNATLFRRLLEQACSKS